MATLFLILRQIFEPVHGSAPDIAGKNLANPAALIFSAIEMLRFIGENSYAEKIDRAIREAIADKDSLTKDLGGNSTTTEFTNAVIKRL